LLFAASKRITVSRIILKNMTADIIPFDPSEIEPRRDESMHERRLRVATKYSGVLSFKPTDTDPSGLPLRISCEKYDDLQRARGAIGHD